MHGKKTLSIILVISMFVTALIIPSSVSATETSSITIHYFNGNNFKEPYVYYYSNNNQPVTWPGSAMKAEGNNWYNYTISNMSEAKIIFSDNGKNQYPAKNEEGLSVSGEKWYKNGTSYNQNPDSSKITVHYYNLNSWSNPYIYYYTNTEQPISWPGVAMTSDGNGWYSYDIYGFEEVKVIFSNNGTNQVPAQNQPGYTVTDEKWFLNGTQYNSEPNGITVHYQDYNNWGNVNIYYYNGNLEGTSWTGVPMYADGDGWYTYKIYGYDEARVIFNNGEGNQIPPAMEPGFLVSDEMWYRNGTWTTKRPDDITVYFYKPDNWSAPNIYYYKNDNDTGKAWPGEAMKQVQDNWYSFTITKYSEAKVMFNSNSKQIPAQNQPGLDAKGVMWYKNGVWCDTESDSDKDELPDYMELILGTDIFKIDTDGDGLPDGYEALTLGTDPTKIDTDNNGVNDGAEDADNDGLTNLKEYQLGTNPTNEDSDSDGLKDGEEVNTYKTDPLKKDTDGDTLSDGDDVALGFSPLLKDTDNNGILDCDEKVQQSFTQEIECEDKPQVTDVSVSFKGTGNINSTTTVTNIYNIDMISTNLVGLVGAPVEIKTESSFDEAVIKFKIDKIKLGNIEFENLGILWYDEGNDLFKMQDTTFDETNSTISATVTHFSKYMVVDKKAWFKAWQQQIVYNGDSEGIQTVLAIDCSGSMSTNDPNFYYTDGNSIHIGNMTYRRMAADSFINAMRVTSDMISIVTFDHSSNVTVPMTNDIVALKAGLSSIYSSGGTNFTYAIQTSLLQFDYNNTEMSNRIILLLTDGEDSVSDSILQSAVDKGVKIYTVGIGQYAESSSLKHIAEYTGGEFYIAKTAEDIVEIYDIIGLNQHIDMTDTDGDGIADTFETAGMRLSNGEIIYTDPLNWDTDGDGIRDGDEIVMGGFGSIHAVLNEDGSYTFTSDYGITFYMKSNPTMSDSDEDGYNDKVDPRPLKCDVFKYALKNEQYVKTLNQNNDLLYGGNQNSIQYKNIPNGGCGVIAAADTLIYLKQQGNIDYYYKYPLENIISRSIYNQFITSFSDEYLTPIDTNNISDIITELCSSPALGANRKYLSEIISNLISDNTNTWGILPPMFESGINNFLSKNKIENYYCKCLYNPLYYINNEQKENYYNDIKLLIKKSLSNDIPIPIMTSFGKIRYKYENGVTQDVSQHWVNITSLIEDNITHKIYLIISTWGKKATINLDDFIYNAGTGSCFAFILPKNAK